MDPLFSEIINLNMLILLKFALLIEKLIGIVVFRTSLVILPTVSS